MQNPIRRRRVAAPILRGRREMTADMLLLDSGYSVVVIIIHGKFLIKKMTIIMHYQFGLVFFCLRVNLGEI
jgi:hypothetical protein